MGGVPSLSEQGNLNFMNNPDYEDAEYERLEWTWDGGWKVVKEPPIGPDGEVIRFGPDGKVIKDAGSA